MQGTAAPSGLPHAPSARSSGTAQARQWAFEVLWVSQSVVSSHEDLPPRLVDSREHLLCWENGDKSPHLAIGSLAFIAGPEVLADLVSSDVSDLVPAMNRDVFAVEKQDVLGA